MDKCRECFRNQPERKYKCSKCNSTNALKKYDGHTLIFNCPDCGHGYISMSYFSPCENDNEYHYKLAILDSELTKEQMLVLKRIFNVSLPEISRNYKKYQLLEKEYYLFQVLSISKRLNEASINYKWSPDPFESYSEICSCDKKLVSRWSTDGNVY